MCLTAPDEFELTRVSIVTWDNETVLDELVKPSRPITDYLTPYSGMTKEKLDPVTTTLADIQSRLLEMLTPRTVLVGHSLNSDLTALKLTHPAIVDTSILYPHPRGPPLKSSLKWLAQKYLRREIQKGDAGHDSIEDARTALDLAKLKCKRGPKWGTADASSESIFKRLSRCGAAADDASKQRTGAVVDWGVPKRGYGAAATVSIGCRNDDEVVAGVTRACRGDADGAEVPGGGVDFVWARMRELEAVRGWWTTSKTADNDALREAAQAKAGTADGGEPEAGSLNLAVGELVSRIKAIYDGLPRCTVLLVYSGNGDPRELVRLHSQHKQFKREFAVKKWDELGVKWTDDEEQALKRACRKARLGTGFVTVK